MTTTAVQSAATGRPAYSQTMLCQAESARHARRLVSSALNTWGLSRLADSATLAVSELVGNAVAHSRCHNIRVTVSRVGPLRVQVAVIDKSRHRPAPHTAAASDEHGRGLLVLDAISDRWGTDPRPWGKRVWAQLCADAERPTPDEQGER